MANASTKRVRLGDVAQVDYGTRIRSKDSTSDKYPVYGGGGKTFGWSDYNRENQCVVSRFAMSEECVRYVAGKFFLNDSGLTLDANTTQLNQDFLNWYLLGHQREIYSLGRGCAQKNLKVDAFLNLVIPIPPLAEQKRIAGVLDKISAMKRNAEARVQKLDLLVKSRFVKMFGDVNEMERWTMGVVGDVAAICVGVVIKPTQYYCEDGIRAFRSLNIGVMNVKDNDWVYFTHKGHQDNQKSVVREGDVLVVRSGAPGTACVVPKQYDGCNAVDIIIAHPNNEKVSPVYLAMFTNMPHGKNQISSRVGGAAQQHFNVGGYKAIKIPLPPLTLQRKFAAFVEKVEKLKATAQRECEQVDLLYRAKLQEYFG